MYIIDDFIYGTSLKPVALAQTYFAIKTRKQEITGQEYKSLSEDERKLYARQNVKDKNKYLFDTAKNTDVKNHEKFNDYDYRRLYNEETSRKIKEKVQMKKMIF